MKEKYIKPTITKVFFRLKKNITIDEQLEKWVAGISIHNVDRNECTPDFSCCAGPLLLAPLEKRQLFYQAHKAGDRKTINSLLTEFLGAMLNENGFELPK